MMSQSHSVLRHQYAGEGGQKLRNQAESLQGIQVGRAERSVDKVQQKKDESDQGARGQLRRP